MSTNVEKDRLQAYRDAEKGERKNVEVRGRCLTCRTSCLMRCKTCTTTTYRSLTFDARGKKNGGTATTL